MCINNAYSDKYKALLQLKTKTEPNKTKLKENIKIEKGSEKYKTIATLFRWREADVCTHGCECLKAVVKSELTVI